MSLSPAATKFINVIEAMAQWPINTTVVEVAGKALSLKMARALVQELRATTTPNSNPIAYTAGAQRSITVFDAIGWIAAHIVHPPTSGSPTPSLTTSPIAAPVESETDNEQT